MNRHHHSFIAAKMNLKSRFIGIFAALMLFSGGIAYAQTSPAENDSIDARFEKLINRSNDYQQYKVVVRADLEALRTATRNKIESLHGTIDTLNRQLGAQKAEVSRLQQQLDAVKLEKRNIEQAKEKVSLLGMEMTKGIFKTFALILIVILIIVILYLVYKNKDSLRVSAEAKRKLAENEDEFDAYRKKALEDQQKLGRQLQDERNKLTEIKGKGKS